MERDTDRHGEGHIKTLRSKNTYIFKGALTDMAMETDTHGRKQEEGQRQKWKGKQTHW